MQNNFFHVFVISVKKKFQRVRWYVGTICIKCPSLKTGGKKGVLPADPEYFFCVFDFVAKNREVLYL